MLNENRAPQIGRVAVWDTEADAKLTQLPAIVNAEKSGSTLALREGSQSTYKKALALVEPGQELAVTGVWGDFVLPARASAPVLMVAAGIGVTATP